MQPPPRPWKQAAFTAIARMESILRGRTAYSHVEASRIRNFLVLQYDLPLGSAVHAAPLYEALKTAVPDAHVTVAASPMAASVLQNNPYIDRCVVTPDPLQNFPRAAHGLCELLGALPSGPRCIVTTIGNRRPRIAMLAVLAGEALRAGHTTAPPLYDIPVNFVPERGQIVGNLDVLRALGHDVAFCEPRLFFTDADAEHAKQLLSASAERSDSLRLAVVSQNSRGQLNQWPAARLQQVTAALSQTCDAMPIFIGTHEQAEAIASLRRELPEPGISLAGKTTVSQLAAVLAQCDLVVSLDTGPFHVARAVGLPGVVIAPAWQNPLEWLPVDHSMYRVLRGPSIPVAPPDYRMEEIAAEAVIQASMEVLRKFPLSATARAARVELACTS